MNPFRKEEIHSWEYRCDWCHTTFPVYQMDSRNSTDSSLGMSLSIHQVAAHCIPFMNTKKEFNDMPIIPLDTHYFRDMFIKAIKDKGFLEEFERYVIAQTLAGTQGG